MRMQRCLNTLYFVDMISSVSYAATGALAVGVGTGVQFWQPDEQQMAKETLPMMRLIWRTDTSTKLDAKDCDITDAEGLTDSDTALLQQLGAKCKPAPLASSQSAQRFFSPQKSQPHQSANASQTKELNKCILS